MRVDFFRVEGPQGATVVRKLTTALGLADDESRTHNIDGVPFRLHTIHRGNRYWEGDMVRIRMDDVPLIMSLSGQVDDIELDDDEGVGEETAFLYEPRTRVLAIQRNRSGVSASKWARFLEWVGGGEDPIIPIIIPEAGAADTIDRFTEVRKIHIKYAAPANAAASVDLGGSVAAGLRELANTAPVMEVTMAMGRQQGGLLLRAARAVMRQAVRAASQALTGDGGRPVDRIDVAATLDGDYVEMNLLQYFMREEVEVTVDADSRRMLYSDRRRGVSDAFGRRQGELERLYVPRRR